MQTGDSGLSAKEGPCVHHSNAHVSPLEGRGQKVRPVLPEPSWRQSVWQGRTKSHRGPGWRFAVLQCCYPKISYQIEPDEVDVLKHVLSLSNGRMSEWPLFLNWFIALLASDHLLTMSISPSFSVGVLHCTFIDTSCPPVFFSAGSTTSSTALQNEGELGDDDVFTVSIFPTHVSMSVSEWSNVMISSQDVYILAEGLLLSFCMQKTQHFLVLLLHIKILKILNKIVK